MHVSQLTLQDREKVRLEQVMLSNVNRAGINQLIREFKYVTQLSQYNLPVNHKVLLHGSSGCGKTMTAKAIADALNKPIHILQLSNIVSARIGETAQHLKSIFERAAADGALLFLDEFDHIAKTRTADAQDVGEMRRLVNSLIQLIDYLPQTTLLVAATNHVEIIDPALVRRFQVSLAFANPDVKTLDDFYDDLVSRFPDNLQAFKRKYGISFAEARDFAYTSIKHNLILGLESGNP